MFPNVIPKHKVEFYELRSDCVATKIENILDASPVHAIHLLLPNVQKVQGPDILSTQHNIYFLGKQFPLFCLIEKEFINKFVKKGSLWIHTTNADGNNDNFVSVIPSGKLLVSLKNEIYQKMGLQGSECCKQTKQNNKHEIMIDLTLPSFEPGKNNYDRALNEFKKVDVLCFDLIFAWKPYDDADCRSLEKYFCDKGYDCSVCLPQHSLTHNYSICVPKVNFFEPFNEIELCSSEDLFEWIGAQLCGIHWEKEVDEHVTSFICPQPSEIVGELLISLWKGFYVPDRINKLIEEISTVFDRNKAPFVAIIAHPYQDKWDVRNNHNCIKVVDRLLCIILFPDLNCWLFNAIS